MFGYMQTMRKVCNINHRTFFPTISWEASLHLYQHTIAILQTSRFISLKIYNVRETRYNEIFGVRLKFINFGIILFVDCSFFELCRGMGPIFTQRCTRNERTPRLNLEISIDC